MKDTSLFKLVCHYFRAHIKLFILDMLCALAIALIDLSFPSISRWCMYKLIPQGMWKMFWSVILVILTAYLLRSIFTYVIWYWGHNFGVLVETDIRRDVFKHMQKLSNSFYDNNRTGQLLSRLTTDLFDITELAHHGPEDLFVSSVTIIGAIIIMFTIQWRLAIVITVIIPISMIIVWHYRKNMRDASLNVKKSTAVINTDFQSAIDGIRTSRAFTNENMEYEKFDNANLRYKNSKYQYHNAMGVFNAVIEFFLCSLSVVVIGVGGALIMKGKLNLIDLITFSLYITAFVSPIRRLSVTTELIANGTAGLKRFTELMRVEPEIKDSNNAVNLADVIGNIDIENVCFGYEKGREILHNISINIHSGETIALVGSSGSGKTTLSSLISRFYDVTSGKICVDGYDIRNVTQQSLHKSIGIVSQDVFLFGGSIADNIAYGKLGATEKEIEQAAKMAEIYDDILCMPAGFQTNVGERGVLLSGGQKQRISIARIFLKNPPILILDEATSALDSVTENKIQKTFEKLSIGRTTIVIAHRLSTVKNADRIVVIEKGRIIEQGNHKELMQLNGSYAQLVHTQELKE